MKNVTRLIFLLLFTLLLSSGRKVPITPLCDMTVGPDIALELGESAEIEVLVSCPLNDLVGITWEPMTYVTCDNALCLEPTITPLSDQCYTVTANWVDGTSTSIEFCAYLEDCNALFAENNIQSISPEQIGDEAEITLEIARTQFVHIELVDGDDILYTIWEGWLKAGQRNVSLDFSNIPAGNYQLRTRLYPDDRFIDIQKL